MTTEGARSFQTTRCHAHDHPEVRFTIGHPLPVPELERHVLDYFENAVAEGTRFEPTQAVRIGSLVVRLIEDDDTYALQAMTTDGWIDDIGPGLLQMWKQLEVARSVSAVPAFPHPMQHVIVCNRVRQPLDLYFMQRNPPEPMRGLQLDTGWYVGCGHEDHDHQDPEQLEHVHQGTLLTDVPHLSDFWALPPGSEVILQVARDASGDHALAHVYVEGEEVEPSPDSYLAARNRAAYEAP